jgi:hypothetical protein
VDVPTQAAIEDAERRLLQLLAAFDEPVAGRDYPLTLLSLGQRSRTLFRGFVELNAGTAPIAARALLRPMLEINLLVRFRRKNPNLHTELWQAEGDRNTVTMAEEIRSTPHLGDVLGDEPLDAEELERRRAVVAAARKRAQDAGLPVGGSTVLPSIAGQLQVIAEPAADIAYTTAYRTASWDIHVGPRGFLVGTYLPHGDGSVSYNESVSAAELLSTRALGIGVVASTTQLIAHELALPIEDAVTAIIDTVMALPPRASEAGD